MFQSLFAMLARTTAFAVAVALCTFGLFATRPARAQTDKGKVTVTAVVIPEQGANLGDAVTASIGMRRGIRAVEGTDYVYASDMLSTQARPPRVSEALDDLDAIADMVRTGDPQAALRRARRAVEILENHLEVVPRADLVDAHMLQALASCQGGRRQQCVEGFEYVLTFREGADYDPVRYPPEYFDLFEETRDRLIETGARGAVAVVTEPAGAEVFVDGRSYGASPAMVEGLLAGAHYATVKAIGYEKKIQRVQVSDLRLRQHEIVLQPSERALLLERDLAQIQDELGETRAGRFIAGLTAYLYASQVLFGVVTPAPANQVELRLYLYDLRTKVLLGESQQTIAADAAGVVQARRAVVALYENVDLSGALTAPEDGVAEQEGEPLWEKWWFWTAVGAVVASGVVTAFALSAESDVPEGWTRVEGAF